MDGRQEINCAGCGRVTLARREAIYEDFKKTGECCICTSCGRRYASPEETPFVARQAKPEVFSPEDIPPAVQVFKASERRHSCGWCRHFIINPFNQRCGLSNREVEATDVCGRFAARPEESAAAPGPDGGSDRLDRLFGTTAAADAPAPGKKRDSTRSGRR